MSAKLSVAIGTKGSSPRGKNCNPSLLIGAAVKDGYNAPELFTETLLCQFNVGAELLAKVFVLVSDAIGWH